MVILFESDFSGKPLVTIVLLDWSCRESLHSLDYLANQTIPREQYEVIWVEYYSRRSSGIKSKLKQCEMSGKHPIIDRWIVMEMPDSGYYHKHLMYNIGIVASSGEIVVLCDSDAVFSPTFVESIIKSFEEDRNIVLHIDEVRNTDKRFYPFNYPTIEEILGEGCINWKDGKTTGLIDKEDPLHMRNYGACMCALREDLISIGGADEHIDYLGHICGPYEMTFRLVNAGKKEVWHEREFLYHTWHPGTHGKDNYLGPHDGWNMSTTALNIKRTKRVMPLVENPAVRAIRTKQDDMPPGALLLHAVSDETIKNWTAERLSNFKRSLWGLDGFTKRPISNLPLITTFFKIFIEQFFMKAKSFLRQPMSPGHILQTARKTTDYIKNMLHHTSYVMDKCNNCIKELVSAGIKEFAIYGTGSVAEVLYKISVDSPVRIKAVYDNTGDRKFYSFDVIPIGTVKDYNGIVVVADIFDTESKVNVLKASMVEEHRIKLL